MTAQSDFVDEIERFLVRTGMSAQRFGWGAMADPMFVYHLRKGRTPTLRIVQKIRDFMAEIEGPPRRKKRTKRRAA